MWITVVANGDFSITPAIRYCLLSADKLLACDNGAQFCYEHGRLPDLVLGDFDSLPLASQEMLAQANVPFSRYPTDKAQTDLEIALLHALTLKPRIITLLGALGGRWDQSLANVLLCLHPLLRDTPIILRAATSSIVPITPAWHYQWQAPEHSVFSLLPLSPLTGVTLSGVRYPLTDATLEPGYTLPVSNCMGTSLAELRLQSGSGWLVVNANAPTFYMERLDIQGHHDRIFDLSETFSVL